MLTIGQPIGVIFTGEGQLFLSSFSQLSVVFILKLSSLCFSLSINHIKDQHGKKTLSRKEFRLYRNFLKFSKLYTIYDWKIIVK